MADPRELIEDVFQLTELQKQPGWEVLTRHLRTWVESHEARLMSGHIDDLYEYKLVAGRTDGIRQVLALPDTLAHALEALESNGAGQQWVDEFQIEPEPVTAATE